MTGRSPSCGFHAAILAVFWAAFGVSTAGAETGLTLDLGAGLNYEAALVAPQVTEAPEGATLTLVSTDPENGESVLSGLEIVDPPATNTFANRTAARAVAMDGYVMSGTVTNAAAHGLVLMGRSHDADDATTGQWNDHWLYETAETYTNGTGTGVWTGTDYATASNGQIVVDTWDATGDVVSVTCTVGTVPSPSRGCVIEAELTFPWPYSDLPDPTGQRAGLTVGIADEYQPEVPNFLYLENGAWTVVPVTVCDPLVSTNWQVVVVVDNTAGTATYYVRARSADPWTILGTAAGVGSDSLEQASFRGAGAVTSVEGHGFDTQLIQVNVEFDGKNLYPGCNFEQTVVTGRVVSSVIHDTDRTGGSYQVRLIGLDGTEIAVSNYVFTSGGTMEFYINATELTAGAGYRAEVILNAAAESNMSKIDELAVMGRVLTNSLWAVTNLWIYENARTYAGADRGSGVWSGTLSATTNGEWICVQSDCDAARAHGIKGITFQPTNTLDETYSSLVTSIRAIFSEETYEPSETNAAFGVTLTMVDGELCFACLVNHVWQAVPRSVATPVLNEEYEFTLCIQKNELTTSYLVRMPDGQQTTLLTFGMNPGLFSELSRVDIYGIGNVTDLKGIPYSTDLIRVHASFDDDTLYPGTNFEQSAANGSVSFEQLWETDRTNGYLRIVIRDKNGLVIGQRYLSFRGIGDVLPFEYYIRDLKPGETYSVDVVADIKGVDSDTTSASGLMARIVTNELWATEHWIRENVETFAGRQVPGTGVWTTNDVTAVEEGEYVSIDTTGRGEDTDKVGFVATNELPTHTGFEYRTRICFDKSRPDFPPQSGPFGISLIGRESDDALESETCLFALLENGVWTEADPDYYEPYVGVEYEVTLHVDLKEKRAYYAVRTGDESLPTIISEFDLTDDCAVTPYETDFYGVGRVRTHEGDGFDVRLVEIEPEYDETSLVPGTNFTQTTASGILHINQLWLTDRTSGNCTVVVRDSHGNVVATNTLTYTELTNQNFSVFIDNLKAGETYDVEIVAEAAGAEVSSEGLVATMARKIGTWICEDVETFGKVRVGTGDWLVTNDAARVEGEDIRISVNESEEPVRFIPTNDTLSVRYSTLREVRLNMNFEDVGWYASGLAPEGPSNALAAVTVWCDDTGLSNDDPDTALAVLSSNGTWHVVEETRQKFATTNACTVTMLVDLTNGFVRYTFSSGDYTNRVYQYDFDPPGLTDVNLAFSGSGSIRTIDGDVWDPNLIRSSTNEFGDLNSAISATDGLDEILEPLWWARQTVTVPRGTFRVLDTNDWLTIIFPDWYFVSITEDGKITIYKFNASNNWIDYAEDGETNIVVTGGSLFYVKTPEGLSWIAAQATNHWISGRIELATNIDLTAHNWTPIAGFSGAFDGGNWTITGLNNTNRLAGVPGGEYLGGPTNEWGRSTYGLFGTVTNASLADVTFAGVAISNLADSVAALAGALAGNCTVSNVTVESGTILGLGGTVAGLAGYADFADILTFVNNTNCATIAADSDFYGEGRAAAGILCVAGPTNTAASLGTVVVTNNVNTGVITNTIYDADLFGGNVAQILAGVTLGARFGDVHLTNNVAAGSVDVHHVNSQVFGWGQPDYPAVNLASAFWGLDENQTFRYALDANEPGAIAVDPVLRTARMLSDRFADGATNEVGQINDTLSTLANGSTYTLQVPLNEWEAIRLDRNITFDLGGNTIFVVYYNNAFEIREGVAATVQNGTIVIGSDNGAFGGDTSQLTEIDLEIEDTETTFEERTAIPIAIDFRDGEGLREGFASELTAEMLNSAGTVILLYEESNVSIDMESGTLRVYGVDFVQLSDAYAFTLVKDEDGTVTGYRVTLLNTAANMPRMSVSVGATQVDVAVSNTRAGMTYQLQKKETMLETDWSDVGEGVPVTESDTPVNLSDTDPGGTSGFYRVMATETAPAEE